MEKIAKVAIQLSDKWPTSLSITKGNPEEEQVLKVKMYFKSFCLYQLFIYIDCNYLNTKPQTIQKRPGLLTCKETPRRRTYAGIVNLMKVAKVCIIL